MTLTSFFFALHDTLTKTTQQNLATYAFYAIFYHVHQNQNQWLILAATSLTQFSSKYAVINYTENQH